MVIISSLLLAEGKLEQQKVHRMLKKANKQLEKNPEDLDAANAIEDLKKKLRYIKVEE